jgi:Asp-tRNA(Asn)/Glu-tRNA(Gln) amidotransferase C subunit
LTPAQVENLTKLNVLAVEDLAQANEQTIMALGLDGRVLKKKAQDWLAAQGDTGKIVEQLSALRVAFDQMQKDYTELRATTTKLMQENEVLRQVQVAPGLGHFIPLSPEQQLANLRSQRDDDFDDITLPGEGER